MGQVCRAAQARQVLLPCICSHCKALIIMRAARIPACLTQHQNNRHHMGKCRIIHLPSHGQFSCLTSLAEELPGHAWWPSLCYTRRNNAEC